MLDLKIRLLAQLLIDADDIARRRGDQFGLCDSIDNTGEPYQSADLGDVLRSLRDIGVTPAWRLNDCGCPGMGHTPNCKRGREIARQMIAHCEEWGHTPRPSGYCVVCGSAVRHD